ncbi:MAG: UDP-2,3-diacylglucosamine hydrolase [Candidatus Amulumruptor caecigallinarius]|uniref:UDP-2,3-diacylglucosamine diphosphatase n=1 Tax=Candidatus Amulumruptor caecigallinarius TaxID=2109911 RepID=A0A4V1LAB6_9BACT|nr:MAG: UDP-2,3-diacylglucosamine hydrolase [Candidatus Amulumruptor caecigallinarius]HJE38367.1 UDP-2,3-diacylglucosamine diphosphatase [Candidatus Amulumruptor caecigallinarius]
MIYFLSDSHLGASYIRDPKAHEAMVVDFLRSIRHDATELYLMGDMLDFWFEYKTVVPRGFVRFFGAVAELADAGVKVYWFKGNHDMWLFDYLAREIGMEVMDGPVVKDIGGKTFLLDHGDGVGQRPAAFKVLRRIFRNPVCRMLYATIHPRWTLALAHGWSAQSRKTATASEYSTTITDEDNEPLVKYACEYLSDGSHPRIDYFVFGHRHAMLDKAVGCGSRVIILGDWVNHFSYACFDGQDISLKVYGEDNELINR